MVDGSGSVGSSDFKMSLGFVSKIVDSFDIGYDRVRVGFIQYSSLPRLEFGMDEFGDKESVQSAIDNIG